jgi:alkyl hydroperoxide reductase subunit AhpC
MIYGQWDDTSQQALTGLVLVDPQGIIRARESRPNLTADAIVASVRSAMPGL